MPIRGGPRRPFSRHAADTNAACLKCVRAAAQAEKIFEDRASRRGARVDPEPLGTKNARACLMLPAVAATQPAAKQLSIAAARQLSCSAAEFICGCQAASCPAAFWILCFGIVAAVCRRNKILEPFEMGCAALFARSAMIMHVLQVYRPKSFFSIGVCFLAGCLSASTRRLR